MNRPLWLAQEISEVIGTPIANTINATGVSIDSRLVKPGDIFFGLQGETNGGQYSLDALQKGAVFCIVDQLPANASQLVDNKIILVDDAYEILLKFARFSRQRMQGKIIAVTGSVGKTSTKAMLNLAFSAQGETFVSQGNFNNHFGLPLCLSQMPSSTEYGVFELGMNAAGEIRWLTELAQPHVSIITTVDAVHLEAFSSVSGIAEAKSEIFEHTKQDGFAILNADNPYYPICQNKAQQYGLQIYTASLNSQQASVFLHSARANNNSLEIVASCFGKIVNYSIETTSEHYIINSLLTLAAVYAAGAELECAALNLSNFSPLQGRGQVISIAERNIILIDESYNASPIAVKAALHSTKNHKNRRKIAILGDMKELGKAEEDLHISLCDDIILNEIDKVFTVGKLMQRLYEKLPNELKGAHADTAQEMSLKIKDYTQDNDVILVKGSYSMQMKKVVDAIINN
jgi:UDP-N-acetylmuramoyl-tripeptide--D-alanyl-D-alanine ligase